MNVIRPASVFAFAVVCLLACTKAVPNKSSTQPPRDPHEALRCDGFSQAACPEGMVCVQDPRPGACDLEKADDCEGVCVARR